MPLMLLGFLRVAWPYILGAIILGAIYYKAQTWCNHACVKQTERADAAEASIKAAQDRATAIALLWSANVTKEDAHAKQVDADRTARFAPIRQAVARLSPDVARTVFPAAAVVVLERAIDAGNATITRPSGEPPEAAGPPPAAPTGVVDAGGITEWGVTVSGLYATCVDRVHGWDDFYRGLRDAQVAEAVH